MTLTQRHAEPGRLVVTAHRGWSGRYPENTLLDFRKAVEIGADVVELDVRRTSDGELVVHDASLDRTTDGTGPVCDQTLAEVERLNATFWHGPHDMDFLQPAYDDLTEDYIVRARAAAARVNVFYANTAERARELVDAGLSGILTDCPDVVIEAVWSGRT